MLKIAVLIIVISIFCSAAIFLLRSLYHFYYMNMEIKSKKHDLIRNLVPLMALTGTPYTEKGKDHLEKFSKNLIIFIVHALLIALAYFILGIK